LKAARQTARARHPVKQIRSGLSLLGVRFPKITFDKAVVSYNSDFVLHFNHPTWREDENGPL